MYGDRSHHPAINAVHCNMKYRWPIIWITAYVINYLSHTLFDLNMSSSLELKSIILEALAREEVTNISKARDYRFRIYWEASVLGSIVAYVTACVWGIRTYIQCIGTTLRHPIILVGPLTIATELFRIGTSGETSAGFNTIFSTTYEALGHSPYVTPDFMAQVTVLIKIINILAISSPEFLLMGICSALTEPDTGRRPSLDLLIERDTFIDQSVIIGSMMLLMGLVHMGCWMDWPVGVWADSDLKTAVMGLTASVYEYWGICFSILLLLVYGGSKWIWKTIVRDVLSANHPDIDPIVFISDHNLGFQIRRHLPHAIAIVLPFLSSISSSGSSIFTMH
jgi:hypothetical protein